MRQADSRRLDRLAGDGSSEAGINLASLFRVIVNLIQDSPGGVEAEAFIAPVQDEVSNHARVEHWYGAHAVNPWHALITDALEQLESRKILAQDDGKWQTGPAFATGKRLTVVPARKGKHGDVGVVPLAAAEREELAAAEKKRMEVTSLAASLREDGPGLRPLNQEHLAVLEQSMRDYGYRPEFPPISDQHGRILDGRHRIAAARRANVAVPPPRIVKVSSDAEAVGFAILVNLQRGWTKAERGRIDSDLQAAGLTLENFGRQLGASAKRERIRIELLEQAELEKPLSHNAIAKRLDMPQGSNRLVDEECRNLINTGINYASCPHRFTEDGKEAPGPKPRALSAAEERVAELLLENPQQSDALIRAAVGLSDNQHRVTRRVRDRLEAEGVIPEVTVREGGDGRVRHVPGTSARPHSAPPAMTRRQSPPPPDAGDAPAENAWSKIMGRLGRLAEIWRNGPPDPAAEREELLAMRDDIDERLKALGG